MGTPPPALSQGSLPSPGQGFPLGKGERGGALTGSGGGGGGGGSYLGCRRVGVPELGVGHGRRGLPGLRERAGQASWRPRAPAAAFLGRAGGRAAGPRLPWALEDQAQKHREFGEGEAALCSRGGGRPKPGPRRRKAPSSCPRAAGPGMEGGREAACPPARPPSPPPARGRNTRVRRGSSHLTSGGGPWPAPPLWARARAWVGARRGQRTAGLETGPAEPLLRPPLLPGGSRRRLKCRGSGQETQHPLSPPPLQASAWTRRRPPRANSWPRTTPGFTPATENISRFPEEPLQKPLPAAAPLSATTTRPSYQPVPRRGPAPAGQPGVENPRAPKSVTPPGPAFRQDLGAVLLRSRRAKGGPT